MTEPPNGPAAGYLHPTRGFGVPDCPDDPDPHCFRVLIPSHPAAVLVREHLGPQGLARAPMILERVAALERSRWLAIARAAAYSFNQRLHAHRLAPGAWPDSGGVEVDRLLGKELCVLAWAVQELPHREIPAAIRHWLAQRPEERWASFSMIVSAQEEARECRRRG